MKTVNANMEKVDATLLKEVKILLVNKKKKSFLQFFQFVLNSIAKLKIKDEVLQLLYNFEQFLGSV